VSAIQRELLRKGIHLFIACVPSLAAFNPQLTFLLVGLGTLFYTGSEILRINGRRVILISAVTEFASRERDRGRIVLGPITLGLGAMAALYFYPEPAAALAIYALAFGDGLSSLFGRFFGGMSMPLFPEKTVGGSLTCFTAVFLVTFGVIGSFPKACVIAAAATLIEMLPLKDLDNLAIPLGTGLVAVLIIPL
jgi:dolichol kinase